LSATENNGFPNKKSDQGYGVVADTLAVLAGSIPFGHSMGDLR
jgi:hypothetical protein